MNTKQSADQPPARGRGRSFQLAALLLTVISALAGTGLARWLQTPAALPVAFPGGILKGWDKPDLVFIFTGQQNGYLLPCGCSKPQIGGLERRYNLITEMRDAGWSVVPVDLGDVPQKTGPAGLPNQQGLLKYVYAMKSMKVMGYGGVGFGEAEANLGLTNALAEYPLNFPEPRVLMANLMDAGTHYPGMTHPLRYVDVDKADLRVGITAVMGPTVSDRLKPLTRAEKATFAVTGKTLDNVVAQMEKAGAGLSVLLYQGPLTRTPGKGPDTEATACAKAYPQFPLVLCLSDEDEPDAKPTTVTNKAGGKSLIVQVGKKGKYIGVVGVWKTAKGFEYKYERVEIVEGLATPEAKRKGHPIIKLMEEYTKELKDKDYLNKYGQVPHALQAMAEIKDLRKPGKVEYVGSEACKRCHEDAYAIWKKTGHAHAYKTLVDAKDPGNRQFDPECIVCHTVGFGYNTGYIDEKKTGKLKDVGCESCHGPASMHVRNPVNVEWQKRINPWRHLPLPREKQQDAIDQMCQKCHDTENDVHWTGGGFKRKWPKVEHMTPVPPEDK